MTSRLRIPCFSLQPTLECGQFFRFTKVLDTYIIQSSDKIFSIRQVGEFLFYEGVEEPFLVHFFRLDEDLDLIYKEIDRDAVIHQAIEKYRGLRMIRQDPWECLISFLCSRAKNIPNIKKTVESICEAFGKEVRLDDYRSWTLPGPGQLADIEKLKAAKTGFRAESIAAANSLQTEDSTASPKCTSPDTPKRSAVRSMYAAISGCSAKTRVQPEVCAKEYE